MKHVLVHLAVFIMLAANVVAQTALNALPRIAIAGLGIESGTFSPAVTHEAAFHARCGNEVLKFIRF
jgi:hypothetical protein